MKPLPENPTFEEVLEIGRESLADSRVMIDNTATQGDSDAAIKAFLLRVVACLESLFDPGPVDEGETRIVAYAMSTFLPVLDFDWLPASPGELPKLSEEDRFLIGMLRRERERQAAKQAGKPAAGTLSPLIDVVSEAIEVFAVFGYKEGFGRAIELLNAIEAHLASSRDGSVN